MSVHRLSERSETLCLLLNRDNWLESGLKGLRLRHREAHKLVARQGWACLEPAKLLGGEELLLLGEELILLRCSWVDLAL